MSALLAPVISVDGPSGVGKGTQARWLARRLGWHRLDSGVLYRLTALAALRDGVGLDDEPRLTSLARGLDAIFIEEGDAERILLGGTQVGPELRLESVGAAASSVSGLPGVRQALLQRQHDFRCPPGLVADGRDMGTVVFPDAQLKIFLDASVEERARRRWLQLSAQGVNATLAVLCADIRARDERDRNRTVAPLRPAEEAVVIDSTALSPEQVQSQLETLLRAHGFSLL